MIELNKIAFIDEDGFDFNDGESLIRFDTVAYYPDRNEIICNYQQRKDFRYHLRRV